MTLANRPQSPKPFLNLCACTILLVVCWSSIGSISCFSQSAPAPPSSSAIAVKTELVVLPVRVTDSDGNFLSGLGIQNFRVYENGQLQRISVFQREDTPVSVGLIVDSSRSMGPKLAEVASAIASFARSSNPRDEMFIMHFSDTVSNEMPAKPFTNDSDELASAASRISVGGGTALYDGVIEGLNHVHLGHFGVKALIIVSDGADNASKHKYADVVALARRSQTLIYSIVLVGADNEEEQPRILQRLSKDTGGMAFFPDAGQSVVNISARIARALREQYTLGFTPERTGNERSFRKVNVKVTSSDHEKIHVQTRPGYFNSEMPVPGVKRAP